MRRTLNEFIELRLNRHNQISIYIKGKKFIQCMRVAIELPRDELDSTKEIESVDEFKDKIVKKSNINKITPKELFWAHLGNIKYWIDNGYDSRALHSNLSFPLLKKLSEVGDIKAKEMFKEEIRYRFIHGYLSTIKFLIIENFLKDFTENEISDMIKVLEDVWEPYEADKGWHEIGKSFYSIEKYQIAIEAFKRALYINPLRVQALNDLATTYYKLEEWKLVITTLKKSLELQPKDYDAWLLLIWAYK